MMIDDQYIIMIDDQYIMMKQQTRERTSLPSTMMGVFERFLNAMCNTARFCNDKKYMFPLSPTILILFTVLFIIGISLIRYNYSGFLKCYHLTYKIILTLIQQDVPGGY